MLDFGFSEILLTSAIALVVLGPERLPKVARQVGNWMGRARAMARQLSEQLEREVTADDLLKSQTRKLEAPLPNRIGPPQSGSASHTPATPLPEQIPSTPTGHVEYDPPAGTTGVPAPDVPVAAAAHVSSTPTASTASVPVAPIAPTATTTTTDHHVEPLIPPNE